MVGDLFVRHQHIIFHILIWICFILIKLRGPSQIVKVKSIGWHMSGRFAGGISLRIDIIAASAVLRHCRVGWDQDLNPVVFPFLPVCIGMPVGISVIVQLLYVTAQAVCQIRLYISSHSRHIIDLRRTVFQSIVFSQLIQHCCIDHGAVHTAEIHRNLIRLFVGKRSLHPFF